MAKLDMGLGYEVPRRGKVQTSNKDCFTGSEGMAICRKQVEVVTLALGRKRA